MNFSHGEGEILYFLWNEMFLYLLEKTLAAALTFTCISESSHSYKCEPTQPQVFNSVVNSLYWQVVFYKR